MKIIIDDLDTKIVFVVGPRQVGKTWLSKEIGKQFSNTTYLNYDSFEDREIIESQAWPRSTELLILDELHKKPYWKNFLKGVFDTKIEKLKILVTGSARLDTFRQSGDSLAGRFFTHRLLPFSMAELRKEKEGKDIDLFLERGGFPEPFLVKTISRAKRWQNQYIDGLIREDILNFEHVKDLAAIKTVFELLRRGVGSPVSFTSIARDINSSPTTVIKYVSVLEALYIIFKVTPFSKNIARSLLKAPKIYFFDTALTIGNEGLRFENHVALSLKKHVLGSCDSLGENINLQYLRTKDGKEVDFCLVKNDGVKGPEIDVAIEAKLSDGAISKNLLYFCSKYGLKGIQLVKELKRERSIENIDVRRAGRYLRQLYL